MDIERFRVFVGGRGLGQVKLRDLQAYDLSLAHLSAATRARRLAAVKSLFGFAHKRLGYLPFDVSAPVKLPAIKDALAERILSEELVLKMLSLEPDPRNHAILRLLYGGGLRVSELCGLKWRDVQQSGDAGQVTVFGKGGKTRSILLSLATWQELLSLSNGTGADRAVFASPSGGHLSPCQVWRIVRAAARRAGILEKVSPHWLRHAHASHSLERGTPLSLIQATLGHSSVAITGRYLHARPKDSSARHLAI